MSNCNTNGTDVPVGGTVYYFFMHNQDLVYSAATVSSKGGTSGGHQIANLHVVPETISAFDVTDKVHNANGVSDGWMCSNQLQAYILGGGQAGNI